MTDSPLTAVIAMTPGGVIGLGGDMPWQLSSDLRRFKRITMGGTLIMGRKTFDSIGKPLAGRNTVVVTRNAGWHHDGVATANDVESAFAQIRGSGGFVVGGGEIYRLFAAKIDQYLLTRVWSSIAGDTFVSPPLEQCRLMSLMPVAAGPRDDVATQFEVWRRN